MGFMQCITGLWALAKQRKYIAKCLLLQNILTNFVYITYIYTLIIF